MSDEIDKIIAARPPGVIVDLSQLDRIDSSGIAALVKLYKGMRDLGGTTKVVGARDQPLAIFKMLRMDKVLGI